VKKLVLILSPFILCSCCDSIDCSYLWLPNQFLKGAVILLYFVGQHPKDAFNVSAVITRIIYIICYKLNLWSMSLKIIVTVLCFFVLVGCVMNKTQADKALEDSITLNLVKQSVMDMWGTPISGYTLRSYNSCSVLSRLSHFVQMLNAISDYYTPNIYRPISCNALDIRLNNKGWYDISASSLVGYYMDKLDNQYEERQVLEQKNQERALKQKVNDMATGKK
jgi:hypothetical protein